MIFRLSSCLIQLLVNGLTLSSNCSSYNPQIRSVCPMNMHIHTSSLQLFVLAVMWCSGGVRRWRDVYPSNVVKWYCSFESSLKIFLCVDASNSSNSTKSKYRIQTSLGMEVYHIHHIPFDCKHFWRRHTLGYLAIHFTTIAASHWFKRMSNLASSQQTRGAWSGSWLDVLTSPPAR